VERWENELSWDLVGQEEVMLSMHYDIVVILSTVTEILFSFLEEGRNFIGRGFDHGASENYCDVAGVGEMTFLLTNSSKRLAYCSGFTVEIFSASEPYLTDLAADAVLFLTP